MMEYRRSRVCGVESGSWVGERILSRTVGDEWFWIDQRRTPVRATIQGVKEINNPYLPGLSKPHLRGRRGK